MVTEIDSSLDQIDDMNLLVHFRNLQSIILCNQKITQIRGLSTLKILKRLWLNDNSITEIEGLDECTNIKYLYLTGNQITKIKGLDNLNKLKVLWLAENKISVLGGLKQLKRLRELNIASNNILTIGTSLEQLKALKEINMANNKIGNLKELLSLKCLPLLQILSFSDPHYGDNPICCLSNYQIYVLYHLPRIEVLDAIKITEDSKVMAEVTFMKKRMFYNMKIKTMKRIASNVMRIIKSCKKIRRLTVNKEIDYLTLTLKDYMRELDEYHSIESEIAQQLGKKKEFIEKKIAKQYELIHELERECEVIKKRCYEVSENNIYRLITELETGGNIRFEEGKSTDKWFKYCKELLQSHFDPSHIREFGEYKLNLTRITKIYNKYLRNQFEERLEQIIDIGNKSTIKRKLDYLFSSCDAFNSAEITKIVEEGFTSLPIVLANTVTLAELPRLYKHSQLSPGSVIIWKAYISKHVIDPVNSEFDPRNSLAEIFRKQLLANKVGADCYYKVSKRDANQKLWIFNDATIVVPEYIAEFEYILEAEVQMNGNKEIDKALNGLITQLVSAQNIITEDYKQMTDKVPVEILQSGSMSAVDLDKSNLSCLKTSLINLINRCSLEKSLKNKMTYEVPEALIDEIESYPPKINKEVSKIPLKDNVTYLNLHHTGIDIIEGLSTLTNLRILILSFNSIKKIEGLKGNVLLERLDLSYNQISKIENMEALENLKVLEINTNYISATSDLNHLKVHNTKLEELVIRNNPFTSSKNYKGKVLALLPQLKKLDNDFIVQKDLTMINNKEKVTKELLLNNAKFSLNAIDSKQALMPNWGEYIEELILRHMKLTKIELLNGLCSLKKLNLSNNKITKIEYLNDCTLLEELNLEHNKISVIENIEHLSQLKILDIGWNKVQVIGGLETLENLVRLSLENNLICSLDKLPSFRDLMELYIGNNLIIEFQQLKNLRCLNKLAILDISGNKVCEDWRSRHYMLFHLRKLKVLNGANIEQAELNEACNAYDGKLTEEILETRLNGNQAKNIVMLDLSSAKLKDFNNIFNQIAFPGLQVLNLTNNYFKSLKILGLLPKLRKLLISQNRIASLYNKSEGGLFGIPVILLLIVEY